MEFVGINKCLNSEDLFIYVMEHKANDAGISYIECLAEFQSLHDLKLQDVVKLIDSNLKEKIEIECRELSLLTTKKTSLGYTFL